MAGGRQTDTIVLELVGTFVVLAELNSNLNGFSDAQAAAHWQFQWQPASETRRRRRRLPVQVHEQWPTRYLLYSYCKFTTKNHKAKTVILPC